MLIDANLEIGVGARQVSYTMSSSKKGRNGEEIIICSYISPVTNIKCCKPVKYPRSFKNFVDTCADHVKRVEKVLSEFVQLDLTGIDHKGILFYIDKFNNVYNTEDVMLRNPNPRIIYKWKKENNEYVFENV